MPTVSSRVDATSFFPQITEQVNDLAKRSVQEAAETGARTASQIASQRTRTGRMAGIQVLPAQGSPDGWESGFQSPVFYAWFHEHGTLGNRRKALKRPASGKRTRDPGTGIEPLGFLAAGRRAGRRAMLDRISGGLPR